MEELHRDKIEKRRREKEAARRKRAEEDRERRRAAGEEVGDDGGESESVRIEVPALQPGASNTGPPHSASSSSSSSGPSTGSALPPTSSDSDNQPDLSNVGYTIIIEPRSDSFAWYDADQPGVTFSSIEAAASAGVWNYPQTVLQESRCRVFEDLWRKGFYMGGGMRFGGDFLVYPGTSSLASLPTSEPHHGPLILLTDVACSSQVIRYAIIPISP